MPYRLSFVDGYPKLDPDPPGAMVQFTAIWRCTNTGDESSPETGAWVDVYDANGQLTITSSGRAIQILAPTEQDGDTLAVGALGRGKWSVRICLDSFGNGDIAIFPLDIQ